MFWKNFNKLCQERKTTPNAVCKELNLSNATATHWKNGTKPTSDILCNVANYFDCSVDYLLGRSKNPMINNINNINQQNIVGNATANIAPNNNERGDFLNNEFLTVFKELSTKQKIKVLNFAIEIQEKGE